MSLEEDYVAGEMTRVAIAEKYNMSLNQLIKTVCALDLKRIKPCRQPRKPGFIHRWITQPKDVPK